MTRKPLNDGFTLVELLVVISIISLLIAILLPVLGIATRALDTGQLTSFTMSNVSPSDVTLIGDYLATNSGRPSLRINLANPGSVDYRMTFRHNGEACNVLCFDMHAGSRTFETIPENSDKFWDATAP